MRQRLFRQVSLACVVALGILAATRSLSAITNFETDVSTAIDRGIEYLANAGAFNNPSAAGDAAGLAMEALLEKRASGNPNDPPQGYTGANATDQGRLRTAAANILDRVNETSFYAYRDGAFMFALSAYAVTGGPDRSVLGLAGPDYQTIKEAMDALVDRTLANQRTGFANAADNGYWCYNNNGCEDSSTTQFAVAGLAAAKTFYLSGGVGDGGVSFNDPARVTAIDTALNLSRQAYELNAVQGSDNGNCNVLTASERGHGYRTGFVPSLQQTASGVYIQLFGGSNVNTAMVQNYIEWLRNRYRYSDLDNMGNSWPGSSWSYYMWSSFKGMELIRQSNVAPNPGNLGPNDLGTLAPASAPACAQRQEHKNPAAALQPAAFGGSGAGIYSAETASQYFDYAHEILTHQCFDGTLPINGQDGFFGCNSTPGYWDGWSHQSYLLLVLLRATGGGCVDTDGDGVCDAQDNCPTVANPNQANTYGGPAGDACEASPSIKLTAATSPGSATAGTTIVSVTGAPFPAGSYTAADITVFIGQSCNGPNPVSVVASSLQTIIGSTKRVRFTIPVTAKNGLDYVWIAGPGFSSVNCSSVTVSGGTP